MKLLTRQLPVLNSKTHPMNEIRKSALGSLGYNFIAPEYLPKGKNEYYLRNKQNRSGIQYRGLTAHEIEVLVRNNNTSDDWNKIWVSDLFDPELVKNCRFFGLVRIGKLEPLYLEFNNIRLQVGLYDSTIISCDFGDNVVVSNVSFMSHYITGNEVMIINVNELATTDHAKFGNGVLKEGEDESLRIWLEVCNENAGRSILPFDGMLPGDAYLWSRHRADSVLMEKFKQFTQKQFDTHRGYYGKIGDRTVIKNTAIIKDVWVGSDAYIKGANKLKNLTIKSSPEAKSQIGEGCEIVNGIIGVGCRIFYGVKAVRFVMASHSQLKYGARLINSYLGNNATISCCEVLNSLIFPAHEQHHNNSFLCAALVMGQSNMAAGATIGSNHNSRGADGEIIAGRGFWPGLCVSLKHNSMFATFTLIAKGDFPAELNIPLPFSLVSNDVTHDKLVVMPGYWFMYNMYALARNASKYPDRDKRIDKTQLIEYDFLAPDSINEMFNALELLIKFTEKAYAIKNEEEIKENKDSKIGGRLLDEPSEELNELEILAEGFENSHRKVQLIKVPQAYILFKELIVYYGVSQLLHFIRRHQINSWEKFYEALPKRVSRTAWKNIGGQLMPTNVVDKLIENIHSGKIKDWESVHAYYEKNGLLYNDQKFQHAFASLLEILNISPKDLDKNIFRKLIDDSVTTKEWMTKSIYESRAKDYNNEFRKMVYESREEMDNVLGQLEENSFIKQQKKELKKFKKNISGLTKLFKL
ncbi:MAG: hypothetical protein JWM28_3211 [Chitinophagaceae bacterium]|nr:hypothetical protein [Chitinophagaceae bacterium]